MAYFVKLKEEDRINLFNNLKKNISSPWRKFYPEFYISRGSFFNYLSGRKDIPLEIFQEWKKLSNVDIRTAEVIERPKYVEKEIKRYELDEELAEILGVLNGDGHLFKKKYGICIVGNALEVEYSEHLKNLFEEKFGVIFRLTRDKSAFRLITYSKKLHTSLMTDYGLPKGNKIGNLKVPSKIWTSDILLKAYIRGLYDTDGGFI